MKNFLQEGKTVDVTASGQAYVSGQPFPIGEMVVVCLSDIADGASGPARVGGVYSLKKKAATAMAFGLRVFWDTTNKQITNLDAEGVQAGWVTKAALAGDTTVEVKLYENPQV